jgi:hypothetical protein
MVGSQSKIMFDELPNVDRIWKLINNILTVRSQKMLFLEYQLYEKLIYIHRDPSLLIDITKEDIELKHKNNDNNNNNNNNNNNKNN